MEVLTAEVKCLREENKDLRSEVFDLKRKLLERLTTPVPPRAQYSTVTAESNAVVLPRQSSSSFAAAPKRVLPAANAHQINSDGRDSAQAAGQRESQGQGIMMMMMMMKPWIQVASQCVEYFSFYGSLKFRDGGVAALSLPPVRLTGSLGEADVDGSKVVRTPACSFEMETDHSRTSENDLGEKFSEDAEMIQHPGEMVSPYEDVWLAITRNQNGKLRVVPEGEGGSEDTCPQATNQDTAN
ncbi:hypothetical protein HPB47_013738 [Ixodes persulcatus]|uniref:Uncharacterized protein n=1 Tax=Ixodes persulcatus TaxID=34615 RepID=A0AC60QZ49_IXOPE|nr:hypothetical protein HPB47_013738 [Ixodes persulcatus]